MGRVAAESEARQRILEMADHLFFTEGIRASGVDTLVTRSGVAKTTLYRHFPSKDDLIVAYLRDRDRKAWEYLNPTLEQSDVAAVTKLYAFLEKLGEIINHPNVHGCPFLLAAGEFPDVAHPAHVYAQGHKERMRKKLAELSREAGAEQPETLATELQLLIDGAYSQRRLQGAAGETIPFFAAATRFLKAYGLDG